MQTYYSDGVQDYVCTAGEMPYIVVNVVPREDKTLLISFKDGKKKIFDMSPVIKRGGVFEKLRDEDFFMKAHADGTTVVWDENIDLAPETLYENGVIV